jgi:dihydroorotate dehydrogenase
VINVTPRYAKLMAGDGKEVIGWENIELISDRPFKIWEDEFRKCKDQFPDRILVASVMEEYNKDAWTEIVQRLRGRGVDGFELNFSCPHGLAGAQDGRGHGREPGNPRRGLRLGHGRRDEPGLGEDDP